MVVIIALAVMIPLGTLPYPPGAEFSDAVLSHWPSANFLRTSIWADHALPLWNPLRMLGQPFAANPLNKVWYPPQWLVLFLPPTLHLNTLIYLHGAWLALGMIMWARRINLHPLAAILAALSWALTPKLIGHLGAGHLDLWYAAAWVPWLLWSVIDARSMRQAVLIGSIAAMLALADLRMAFYMIPVTVIYAVLNQSVSRKWALALFVLLGLTAVQIVPLVRLSSSLTRSQITAQQAAEFSLTPIMLIGVLIPDAGGFHEYLTYLGLPIVALALISLRHPSRRIIVGWWLTAAISTMWALGENGPLFMIVARLAPFTAWFRVPSRAWFVVSLTFAILAAYGVDTLIRHGLPRRARLIGVATAFAGLVWALASLAILPPLPDLRFVVISVGVLLLVTGASVLLVAGFPSIPSVRARLFGASMLVTAGMVSYLMLVPMFVQSRRVVLTTESSAFYISAAADCDLIYSPSFALLDPPAAASGIRTLHTADPFQFVWSAQAIAAAANVPYTGYSITAPPIPAGEPDARRATSNSNALAVLGVTAIIAPYRNPMPLKGETRFNDDLYYVPLPSNPQPLRLCEPGPNRYEGEINALKIDNGIIPIAMAWSPDWRAWLNDQPIPTTRVNDAMLGVEVPGDSEGHLVIRYQPTADYVGMAITLFTSVVIAVLWWRAHG